VSSCNGQIRIASPKEKVMNLIKVTKLDRVLSVSDSVEEAISEMA
jgi:anti-anti-sigma regulatory factor